MNIDIYQLFQDLTSNLNVKQAGHLRVRDFNNWVNQISLALFKEKFVAWERDQAIVDDMSRPFLESKSFVTQKTLINHALLPYPSDYAFFSSARIFKSEGAVVQCPTETEPGVDALANVCETNAVIVSNDRWGSICDHKLLYPTLDRVFITEYEGGFKVAPKEIGFITLDYLRYPKKSKLVFLDPLAQTLDTVNTINLEWNQTVTNEFLARLKIFYAGFVREPFLEQTGRIDKDTTA